MALPSFEIQQKAVLHVRDFMTDSKRLSATHKEKLFDIYSEWKSFSEKKTSDWSTTFKINKAHQVVETVLPRLTAKDPRWIVSPRIPDANPEYANAIQDYLTYLFDEYNLIEPIRLWAKSVLVYGNAYAKVKYKYEIARVSDAEDKIVKKPAGLTEEDSEEGMENLEDEPNTSEEVSGEYPTIENLSWTDVYVDPRYTILEDMPGIVHVDNAVRVANLHKSKRYFNLDKIEDLGKLETFKNDENGYKQRVLQITGIDTQTIKNIDVNALTIQKFYGFFNPDKDEKPEKERLYELHVIDDLILCYYKEITHIPIEDIKAFEDPEQHFATGFVEPIMELQREMNFKKNSASTYINNSLNRSWLWSPNSNVNPRDLISRPNNIIVVEGDVQNALNNLSELPHREVSSDFFQEQNDIERQVQAMTFTVDTSNPRSQQALTNTATGARIKFFESNSVIDEIRKHFEQGLEKLAYKLLLCTFENMEDEDNIVFKKQGNEEYWAMNKEMLRNAVTRYSIKVEVNSSSFNDLESRREDAIAFYNILSQAYQMQVITKEALQEGLKEVMATFEKKDAHKYISQQNMDTFLKAQPQNGMPGQPGAPGEMPPEQAQEAPLEGEQAPAGGGSPLPQPERTVDPAELVTNQVAGGSIF